MAEFTHNFGWKCVKFKGARPIGLEFSAIFRFLLPSAHFSCFSQICMRHCVIAICATIKKYVGDLKKNKQTKNAILWSPESKIFFYLDLTNYS